MTNHSRVPSSLVEITSERIASSVARPPALRITWASPSARPAYLAGSSRASMQVRMAKRRAGGMASLPLSPKLAAYASLAASTSCKIGAMVNPSLEKLSIVQLFIPLPSSNSRSDDSSVKIAESSEEVAVPRGYSVLVRHPIVTIGGVVEHRGGGRGQCPLGSCWRYG